MESNQNAKDKDKKKKSKKSKKSTVKSQDCDEPDGAVGAGTASTGTATKTKTSSSSSSSTTATASRPQRKQRKRKVFEITETDFLPSHERKTENGGYAHTSRSKTLISKANRGNTPWNKGGTRSSADKAKIAAGVRARNRAVLLEKLKRLGLTEEEYAQKKKEVKYLRERVRRAKLANEKHRTIEAELKLKAALEATQGKTATKNPKTKDDKSASDTKEAKETKETKITTKEPSEEDKVQKAVGRKVFSRDVNWTEHSFFVTNENDDKDDDDDTEDHTNNNDDVVVDVVDGDEKGEERTKSPSLPVPSSTPSSSPYDKICPIGGPGGLICCESCSHTYSLYLSSTVKDMEQQRAYKCGTEVKQLMEFLEHGKIALGRAMKLAKAKVPPLPPPINNTERTTLIGNKNSSGAGNGDNGSSNITNNNSSNNNNNNNSSSSTKSNGSKKEKQQLGWNLTSAIDVGFVGRTAAV